MMSRWKDPGRQRVFGLDHRQQRQLSSQIRSVPSSGTSYALESLEASFNQDLNGDGSDRSYYDGDPDRHRLVWIDQPDRGWERIFSGQRQWIWPGAASLNGAPVAAGQFGGWVPIGAVQTASGYDVAWKSRANRIFDLDHRQQRQLPLIRLRCLSGTSYALESSRPIFNQDLNGDGVIGLPKTVIQTDTGSFGTTSLTEVGNEYYFLDNGSGSGPALQAERRGRLWRVSSAPGRRSARCRRQADTMSPGRSSSANRVFDLDHRQQRQLSSQRLPAFQEPAIRWNRTRPFSTRTSMATG